MKSILFVLLSVATFGSAQQRILVSRKNEIAPLRPMTGDTRASRTLRDVKEATGTCGSRFTFGYRHSFSSNPEIPSFHKDVVGEWFVAPVTGTIDTLTW